MNRFFTSRPLGVFGFALALLVFGMAAPVLGQEVSRIEPDKLEGLLGAPDLMVVDVRSNGQRRSSGRKIRTALLARSNRLENWTGDLAKKGMIVLYCD
ncbi:MAG: rhodanese-like domain-containing protein [Desulfococcaceae bacterium]